MKALQSLRRASLIAIFALAGLLPLAHAETVIRFVPYADLKIFDPIWTTDYMTRDHGFMVFDTLFGMDADGHPQPQMVDRWTVSDDKLSYTFTLRQGLKWHDGAPVSAEDCVASLQRWGKRDGLGQQLLAATASLEPLDASTFRLVLKEPFGLVIDALAKTRVYVPFMMPKRLAATAPTEQIRDVIGSGPFKFVKDEWVPGSKTVYVKNPDYLSRAEPASGTAGGKVVKVDRVEWLYIPDQQTAMNALINGEVDYFQQFDPNLVPILAKTPGVVVEPIDINGNLAILRPNHLIPPFDNVEARRALLHLIDQNAYLLAGFGNPDFFHECHSFYGCGTPLESDPDPASHQRDLEKAKALIQQAGYTGHKVVILQPVDQPEFKAFAALAAQDLRAAGLDAELQAMDWSSMVSRRAKKDPIENGGWNLFPSAPSVNDLSTPLHSIWSGGGPDRAWFGWPSDARLEALRGAFVKETDPDKRKALAIAAQARAVDIVLFAPVGTILYPSAYRANLKGILKAPVYLFWNIEKR